jgi:hypothetical protein
VAVLHCRAASPGGASTSHSIGSAAPFGAAYVFLFADRLTGRSAGSANLAQENILLDCTAPIHR